MSSKPMFVASDGSDEASFVVDLTESRHTSEHSAGGGNSKNTTGDLQNASESSKSTIDFNDHDEWRSSKVVLF